MRRIDTRWNRILFKGVVIAIAVNGSFSNLALAGNERQDKQLNQLADQYFQFSIDNAPEYAMLIGQPDTLADSLSDNNLAETKKQQQAEDKLLSILQKIDPEQLSTTSNRVTYYVLDELLNSAKSKRVCRSELWGIDHTSGWQVLYPQLIQLQSVDSKEDQANIIRRWRKLPAFLRNQRFNLTQGLKLGYSAPKSVVRRVIDQINGLLELKTKESPLYSPASRSHSGDFRMHWKLLVDSELKPAIKSHVEYLEKEYLANARSEIGLIKHPDGLACYIAHTRAHTGLKLTPEEIYEQGGKLVAANTSEVIKIGKRLWGTTSFPEAVAKSKKTTGKNFDNALDMVSHATSAVERARIKSGEYFSLLPKTTIRVEPYADYLKGSGISNAYQQPNAGVSYGVYKINTFTPEKSSRAQQEVTAYHEGYPGHHVQIGIATEISSSHQVMDLYGNTAFVEGWARYAEHLAEEMNLYSEPSANIIRRSWPGRGMVVDPGLHLFGWSRKQAVAYINESGRFAPGFGDELVDRIAVMPGQLTSYDLGALEFFRLRKLSHDQLGDEFDIKEFHRVVLGRGNVPLVMLNGMVQQWLDRTP